MNKGNYIISQIFHFLTITVLYLREILLLLGANAGFVSTMFYLFIILCAIWMGIQSFVLGKEKNSERQLLGIVYLILSVLIIYTTYNMKSVVETQLNEAIGELIILLLFYGLYTNRYPYSISMLKLNTVFNMLFSFLLFLKSFSPSSYLNGDLVYGYLNPNSTGLASLITVFCIFIGIKSFKNSTFRITGYICAVLAAFICFKSGSRSAIIALLFSLIIVLYKKITIRNSRNFRLSIKFLVAVQLFVMLYPFLWSMLYAVVTNHNIQILGKPLFSNRELIWAYMISILTKEPFVTHLGESFVYGSGSHNVFMSIWWTYGIIAVICFHIILYKLFRQINNRINTRMDMQIVICLVSLLSSMSFEALLFSGGVNFTFRVFYLGFFIGNNDLMSLYRSNELYGNNI